MVVSVKGALILYRTRCMHGLVQRRVFCTFVLSLFQVEVLPSLQRPKKVAVLASDGHIYNLLCKPKVC